GRGEESPLAALLVRARDLEHGRNDGPRLMIRTPFARTTPDGEVRDAERSLAMSGADAIGSGIAAADHDHVPSGRRDLLRHGVTRDATVRLDEVIHRDVHAIEIPPGNLRLARQRGAGRDHDRVVAL